MILNLQHWLQQTKQVMGYGFRVHRQSTHNQTGFTPILIIGVIAAVAIIGFSLLTSILNPVIKNSANSSNQPKYSSSPTEVAYLPTTSPTFSPSEEPAEVCSDCDEDLEGEDVLYADLEGAD